MYRFTVEDVASLDIGSVVVLQPVRIRAFVWKVVDAMECIFAGVALTLASPILLIASITVVVLSRRSPFVSHQRVGQGGRAIRVLKLRTMWQGDPGERFTLIHQLSPAECPVISPRCKNFRVTSRFAALCRRYSVDELPQLWQVITGDLALVGPRPLTRRELDVHYGPDAAACIVAARPGLTGLWQISGRSRLSYSQRRRLDVFLVRNWSLALYSRILFRTPGRVLTGKDAW